jgi:hypothetical protein
MASSCGRRIDLAENLSARQEELAQALEPSFAGLFLVSALTSDGVDNLFHFAAAAGYRLATTTAKDERGTSWKFPPLRTGYFIVSTFSSSCKMRVGNGREWPAPASVYFSEK